MSVFQRMSLICGFAVMASLAHAQISDKDVLDKLVLAPKLKTFVNLLAKADMIEMLKAGGPFTIFAPTDEAFAKLPLNLLTSLKKDKTLLKKFLTYQMAEGILESKNFKEGPLKTIEGEATVISIKKELKLNTAQFLSVDDTAANGVVHIVDTVSIPPSFAKFVKAANSASPPPSRR